jgi:hypothetical protein
MMKKKFDATARGEGFGVDGVERISAKGSIHPSHYTAQKHAAGGDFA